MITSFQVRIIYAILFFAVTCAGQLCAFAEEAVSVQEEEAKPQEKAVTAGKEKNGYSFEYELDPYYTNAAIIVNLTGQPIPDAGTKPELQIYRDLFVSSYIPRYIVSRRRSFPCRSRVLPLIAT